MDFAVSKNDFGSARGPSGRHAKPFLSTQSSAMLTIPSLETSPSLPRRTTKSEIRFAHHSANLRRCAVSKRANLMLK